MPTRPRPLSRAGGHISQLPRRPPDCGQQAVVAPWVAGWPKPQMLASPGARAEMAPSGVSHSWWTSSQLFSLAEISVYWRAVFSAQDEWLALNRSRGKREKGREIQPLT